MSLLDAFINSLRRAGFIDLRRTTLPGWAHPPTRFRKLRQPFSSTRRREPGPLRMHVEEFLDKHARDARFRELRAAKGSHDISKFSTVRPVTFSGKPAYENVWCVVRP